MMAASKRQLHALEKADSVVRQGLIRCCKYCRVPSGALNSLALTSSGSLTVDPATLNSKANLSVSLTGQGYLFVENATVNGVTAMTSG